MRIRLSNAIVEKLEKEVLTAQRLNNLRLYKMAIALLLINTGVGDADMAQDIGGSKRKKGSNNIM